MPLTAPPSGQPEDQPALVAASDPLRKLLSMAERVARSSATVLIYGETGSGKQLIASHIHRHSLRAGKPLIEINCAAIPENLVESELFGYEKGAFSGADAAKPGLFELGDTGTVFLDEIGELDFKVQAKLLRILDGAPYYRLGGNRKITTNARVIAATNRNLEQAVAAGTFRADLFHRLAQFHLRVPALRERPDDILPLAKHFLEKSGHANARFSPEALELLRKYDWPGNARELHNVVLQGAVTADGDDILAEHLSIGPRQGRIAPGPPPPTGATLGNVERDAIKRALETCANNHTAAAELLGISRRTLLRKLKAYRQSGSPVDSVLGKLSPQQHKAYRSAVDIPAELETETQSLTGIRIVNLSLGGIGVTGVKSPFELAGTLKVKFQIPSGSIEATGRMQWAEPEGRVGIRFVSLAGNSQSILEDWLRQRQMEDGWALQQQMETAPGAGTSQSS